MVDLKIPVSKFFENDYYRSQNVFHYNSLTKVGKWVDNVSEFGNGRFVVCLEDGSERIMNHYETLYLRIDELENIE